jgi:hypothetical protein
LHGKLKTGINELGTFIIDLISYLCTRDPATTHLPAASRPSYSLPPRALLLPASSWSSYSLSHSSNGIQTVFDCRQSTSIHLHQVPFKAKRAAKKTPDIGISNKAMAILNSFVNDIFERATRDAPGKFKHHYFTYRTY